MGDGWLKMLLNKTVGRVKTKGAAKKVTRRSMAPKKKKKKERTEPKPIEKGKMFWRTIASGEKEGKKKKKNPTSTD